MSVQYVKFSELQARPEDYAFRRSVDSDPFSEAELRSLMEAIKAVGGITVPLLVKILISATGKLLVLDGHRRFFALLRLIEAGVAGFNRDMLIPVQVMDAQTPELTAIAAVLASNVERKSLTFEGYLDAVMKLNKLGMPVRAIAELLHLSDTTINRYLLLGGDEKMRTHISRHHITATNAAMLVAVAAINGRQQEAARHALQLDHEHE